MYGALLGRAYLAVLAAVPWSGAVASRPWVAAPLAFVAVDAATWAHHRLSHRSRLGWFCHRPHHSGDVFDATLALRQSWLPIPSLVVLPAVAVTGAPFALTVVVVAFTSVWAAATHSATLRLPVSWSTIVVTPDLHRRHHLSDGGDVNLGGVLTVWDRLAGTYHPAVIGPIEEEGDGGTGVGASYGVHDGRSLVGSLTGRGGVRPAGQPGTRAAPERARA